MKSVIYKLSLYSRINIFVSVFASIFVNFISFTSFISLYIFLYIASLLLFPSISFASNFMTLNIKIVNDTGKTLKIESLLNPPGKFSPGINQTISNFNYGDILNIPTESSIDIENNDDFKTVCQFIILKDLNTIKTGINYNVFDREFYFLNNITTATDYNNQLNNLNQLAVNSTYFDHEIINGSEIPEFIPYDSRNALNISAYVTSSKKIKRIDNIYNLPQSDTEFAPCIKIRQQNHDRFPINVIRQAFKITDPLNDKFVKYFFIRKQYNLWQSYYLYAGTCDNQKQCIKRAKSPIYGFLFQDYVWKNKNNAICIWLKADSTIDACPENWRWAEFDNVID